MNKIRMIMICAFEKYKSFLLSKKSILMIYSLVFIAEDIILKMVAIVDVTDCKINKLEPYVLILTDIEHFIIIPLMFLALLSDIPELNGRDLFVIHRIGKKQWLFAQIVYACFVGGTYLFLILTAGIILTGKMGEFGFEWSEYSEQLYIAFPELYQRNEQLFLSENVVTHGNVIEVSIHSTCLIMLFFALMVQLLILFRLKEKNGLGIVFLVCMVAIGWMFTRLNVSIQWFFPLSHMMYGMHFESFLSGHKCSLLISYIYFLSGNMILVWLNSKSVADYKDW